MTKYHECGRFVMNDSDIDWEAAVYHEEQAARLGIMEAIIIMAKLYLGLPRDILSSCIIKVGLTGKKLLKSAPDYLHPEEVCN
jgi:elongation factor 2 kinase